MLKSFTRNHQDDSTEAGFQFTFYCDICGDGYKSSFIQSETYKKGRGIRGIASGASVVGNLLGGGLGRLGWAASSGANSLAGQFENRSPEWMKEHEKAFEMAQNEAQRHFHRCESCHKWVCDSDFNEDEGLCVQCAPRQEIYVAKARAEAMRRNIDAKVETATVWQGELESKVTVCPVCGKPAGNGKFCNNCGAKMEMVECPKCGTKNAPGVRFCGNCGANLKEPAGPPTCPACGTVLEEGVKFCGSCGAKV